VHHRLRFVLGLGFPESILVERGYSFFHITTFIAATLLLKKLVFHNGMYLSHALTLFTCSHNFFLSTIFNLASSSAFLRSSSSFFFFAASAASPLPLAALRLAAFSVISSLFSSVLSF
jgi:hypothetical protein